ncbi:hypothetical protein VPH35_026723 [Triticum aestivum]
MSDSDQEDFPSMVGQSYHDESLRPPPESGDGESATRTLIDNAAYMMDTRNHTSAQCPVVKKAGRDGARGKQDLLQVTFCLAPPPHISYFCVSYGSGEPTQFGYEPRILATEGNLAVRSNYLNFVYRAPVLAHELPSLRRLPHPGTDVFPDITEGYLPHGEVGILRYRARSDEHYDAYMIATLCSRSGSGRTTQYDLCTYDSEADAWTRTPTAFSPPQEAPLQHTCERVITIGGKMGWVDLWRGMILCDVHVVPAGEEDESPGPRPLCYIPLPEPMQPHNDLRLFGFSSFFRDIAVVDGRIKFVDLQLHASPGSLTPNRWTAVTWSMAAGDSGFREDMVLNSGDIINNALQTSLFVAHPKLSSHDDDLLYLMTKVSLDDRVACVIAVDMRKKKVQRMVKFTIQREACTDFAYIRTTISNYLSPDSQGKTKRGGPPLQEPSRKKPREDLPPMADDDDRDGMDLD